METINAQNILYTNKLFTHVLSYYIDSKALYMYHFNAIPCVYFFDQTNGEKALEAFIEKYACLVMTIYQYQQFNNSRKEIPLIEKVVVLNNHCILVFNTLFCEILYTTESQEFVTEVAKYLCTFKQKERRRLEMNLIVSHGGYLNLKPVEIKRTVLDLDLFYEDDLKQIDEMVRKRLNRKNDKGIILFHGLPGTGKTTYLRYLIGKTKKSVLFLPPHMAASLIEPGFADIFIQHPNTVLIIEDAENIIMDRKACSNNAVSTLLNLSDGLLSDSLNVQIICTFNSSLPTIDKALLRKGRLIAKYEFKKLCIAKAQRLSDHFGFNTIIDKPMTVAEIINQHEKVYNTEDCELIGFKRNSLAN